MWDEDRRHPCRRREVYGWPRDAGHRSGSRTGWRACGATLCIRGTAGRCSARPPDEPVVRFRATVTPCLCFRTSHVSFPPGPREPRCRTRTGRPSGLAAASAISTVRVRILRSPVNWNTANTPQCQRCGSLVKAIGFDRRKQHTIWAKYRIDHNVLCAPLGLYTRKKTSVRQSFLRWRVEVGNPQIGSPVAKPLSGVGGTA